MYFDSEKISSKVRYWGWEWGRGWVLGSERASSRLSFYPLAYPLPHPLPHPLPLPRPHPHPHPHLNPIDWRWVKMKNIVFFTFFVSWIKKNIRIRRKKGGLVFEIKCWCFQSILLRDIFVERFVFYVGGIFVRQSLVEFVGLFVLLPEEMIDWFVVLCFILGERLEWIWSKKWTGFFFGNKMKDHRIWLSRRINSLTERERERERNYFNKTDEKSFFLH